MAEIKKITLSNLLRELKQKEDIEKAKILARFFKTGPGQYGEGDLFLGITVPESRKIALRYSDLPFSDISKLIKNKYHEARLVALLILVHKYKSSQISQIPGVWETIVDFYLAHTKYINNWDLVDLSAHYILGNYLISTDSSQTPGVWEESANFSRTVLGKLAKSENLWERRIAIVSTFAFIYKGESKLTFQIVKMLLKDPHDLIHKACGWMLREVGKRVSENELKTFLDIHSRKMPRTMLRYAIERLPEKMRLHYLKLR